MQSEEQNKMENKFNPLELSILDWYKITYKHKPLTMQLENAKLYERKWTGVGFFVYIEVPKELEAIDLGEFEGHWPINGPVLHSEDIQHGGDVILWGTNGYIDCIEMYAFGEYFHETVIAFELT